MKFVDKNAGNGFQFDSTAIHSKRTKCNQRPTQYRKKNDNKEKLLRLRRRFDRFRRCPFHRHRGEIERKEDVEHRARIPPSQST